MPLTLHPLACTTPRTRAELQAEDPALNHEALARRYGVTAPTVRKWRERDSTADRSHRPATRHCTLSAAQEAVAMEIRRTLWLPLDDLLVVVREFLQFTDRFTSKSKAPSGQHAFDRECALLGVEHRLIKPRHPQTNGMVERFNGRISDILATTRFRSREDLQTTSER